MKNKISVLIISLILGASFAVYSKPMVCDMSKCTKVDGGYLCEKDACKEV